jgi:hypothetical protein
VKGGDIGVQDGQCSLASAKCALKKNLTPHELFLEEMNP